MDNLPEWFGNVLYAALGGLGALGLGLIRARVDNTRTRTEDRTAFTGQLLERVTALEQQNAGTLKSLADERRYCEDRMVHLEEQYEKRLQRRDQIITELRQRDADREQRLTHLERLVQGLDQ